MSKLKLVILTGTIVWWGAAGSQLAIATQSAAVSGLTTTQIDRVGTDLRYFALAKKCTLRRYRRPH